ncbi:MAG: hypothetical protein GY856_18535 [bacterium]|nr:hypothetical protein [bacterium]
MNHVEATATPSPARSLEGRIPSSARLRLGLLALFPLLLVLSAWIQDDAYITFRTIDNFVNGLGLTWNPGERVQVYTHPLWMLVNTGIYTLTREVYFSCLSLSMVLSFGVFYLLLFKISTSAWTGCIAGFLLLMSRSFVEYSTSGLENPLTHFLLVLFALVLCRTDASPQESHRKILGLALLAALGSLARLDALLLFLPALGYVTLRARSWKAILWAALGFAPLLAWELFALIYYGSLVPNPAYAKLGIGVARSGFVLQGLYYLLYSLLNDPVTVIAIAGAAVAALRRRARIPVLMAAGSLLYVGYVVWVGGGYMGGRFLSAPLLGAAISIAGLEIGRRTRRQVLAGLVIGGLLILRTASAPVVGFVFEVPCVGDERLRFYHATGLLNGIGQEQWPNHFFRRKGEYARQHGPRVLVDGYVGFLGFYAGPEVHVIDLIGLPDPLLARLPGLTRGDFNRPGFAAWLPGHVPRRLPPGYVESIELGENRIRDPHLAEFYDKIRRITRGPLWDRQRWIEIWKLHCGGYDHLIEAYVEAHPDALGEPPDDLRTLFTFDANILLEESDSKEVDF